MKNAICIPQPSATEPCPASAFHPNHAKRGLPFVFTPGAGAYLIITILLYPACWGIIILFSGIHNGKVDWEEEHFRLKPPLIVVYKNHTKLIFCAFLS